MILSNNACAPVSTPWDRAREYKTKIWRKMKRCQIQAMNNMFVLYLTNFVHWRSSRYIVAHALLTLFLSSSLAFAQGSSWKVGRGVISGSRAESGLSLKISLRNTGAPSTDTVSIMGRWSQSQPGKKSIAGSELASFVELGYFTREVEMKQTVILEIKLAPLGLRPAQKKNLEIAVITGSEITDGAVIPINL